MYILLDGVNKVDFPSLDDEGESGPASEAYHASLQASHFFLFVFRLFYNCSLLCFLCCLLYFLVGIEVFLFCLDVSALFLFSFLTKRLSLGPLPFFFFLSCLPVVPVAQCFVPVVNENLCVLHRRASRQRPRCISPEDSSVLRRVDPPFEEFAQHSIHASSSTCVRKIFKTTSRRRRHCTPMSP